MDRVVVEITVGPYAGRKTLVPRRASLRFGRTERADYVIPHDPRLSSLHFQIAWLSDDVAIEDLGSSNGTFVNGERIQQHGLSDGDVIKAGETTFRVHLELDTDESRAVTAVTETASSSPDEFDHVSLAAVSSTSDEDADNEQGPESPTNEIAARHRERVPSMAAAGSGSTPSEEHPDVVVSSETPRREAVLVAQTGSSAGRKIWLRRGQSVTIGNSSLADVSFPDDAAISPSHCQLTFRDDRLIVRDLASTDGTFINEARVEYADLAVGDELRLGSTRILTTEVGGSQRSAPDAEATISEVPTDAAPGPDSWIMAIPAGGERPFKLGLQDEEPEVRREALLAAAWTRQPWLLDYMRRVASQPSPEAEHILYIYAILAPPSDLQIMLRIGNDAELGPSRMRVLGAFGHPGVVDMLLAAMSGDDKATAFAAGQAFTKITAADIESEERVTLPPADGSEPDEFEAEFLDEVKLPDPQLAVRHWKKVQEQYHQGSRWCRGFNLSSGASPEMPASLDLESRWEACLRARYEGRWQGSLAELTRLSGGQFPRDNGGG